MKETIDHTNEDLRQEISRLVEEIRKLRGRNEMLETDNAELRRRLETIYADAGKIILIGGGTAWQHFVIRRPEVLKWFTAERKAK